MPTSEPIPFESSFDGLYGLEWIEHGPELARGRVAVHDGVRQPYGLVHGGVFAAIAEALASRATIDAVAGDGRIAVGQSNNVSFLRPIVAGSVNAVARRRHRGRTSWIWDVELTDDDDRLCAIARVTIAVRQRGVRQPGSGW